MLTRCCSPPEKVWARGSRAVRDVETFQKLGGAVAGLIGGRAKGEEGFGHDVKRRHAGHDAEKLADVTEGVAAKRDDLARFGGGDVGVAHDQASAGGQVVAVDHAHQGGFPRAGLPGEAHAFPGATDRFAPPMTGSPRRPDCEG